MKPFDLTLLSRLTLNSPAAYGITLAFLFFIPFSIFVCYLLFSLLLIQLMITGIRKEEWPRLPGFLIAIAFFCFFTLVSTLFSIDRMASFKDNRALLVFLLIPIFITVLHSLKRVFISILVVAVSSVISALFGLFTVMKEGISLDHRLKGFTSHWMTYAGLLMLVFVFLFIMIFMVRKMRSRLFLGITLALLISAILASQTRSVWVGIAVSLVIFTLVEKPKLFLVGIPGLFLIAFLLPETVKERMVSIADPDNPTNRDRIHMLHTGAQIFKNYPLTGVGANNVEKVYRRFKHPQATLENPHLHNNFIHILAERGVFALLALMVLFGMILVAIIRRTKTTNTTRRWLSKAALMTFLAFLVAGLFEYNFGDSEIRFLLLYFVSLPFCLPEKDKHDPFETI